MKTIFVELSKSESVIYRSLFPSPSDTTKDVMLVWTVNPVSAQKIMMTDPGQIFLKILPISRMLGIFASTFL
jgi:hypothetical protein